MSEWKESVIWLTYGERTHPCHEGFREALGCDVERLPINKLRTGLQGIWSYMNNEVRKAPIYIVDSTEILFSLPFLKRDYPSAHVIYYAAEPHIFHFKKYHYSKDSVLEHRLRMLNQWMNPQLLKYIISNYVEGIIANSSLVLNRLRSLVSKPMRTVLPYIPVEREELLTSIDYRVDTNKSLTVSLGRYIKGVDLLVEAWPKIRSKYPDAELTIIGRNHPQSYEKTKGVRCAGYVNNKKLATEIKRSAAYVHPSVIDTFGVSVLEAMWGSIPIVTTRTGAKELIQPVDDCLIVQPSPKSLAEGVKYVLSKELDERKTLVKKARSQAKSIRSKKQKEKFVSVFEDMIK